MGVRVPRKCRANVEDYHHLVRWYHRERSPFSDGTQRQGRRCKFKAHPGRLDMVSAFDKSLHYLSEWVMASACRRGGVGGVGDKRGWRESSSESVACWGRTPDRDLQQPTTYTKWTLRKMTTSSDKVCFLRYGRASAASLFAAPFD